VRVERRNGAVEVEIRDDGIGGAEIDDGTGLRGLEDRVGALEGRFSVHSRTGAGTTVEASIPCA
jgi:signal transduction histidine kinase